ncbi:MAG: putative ABC transport system permease protein [Cyclobacteriaceae bacterium]|jgi:putative ABC transport system permease protein
MFKNYLKVALRTLIRNKNYVIINSLGLGIAMACCIAAYLFIAFNVEFDSFHKEEKVKNIFRTHAHVVLSGGELRQGVSAPILVGPMAFEDISGIKSYLRYAGNAFGGASVSYVDIDSKIQKAFAENVVFADSNIFEMFDFPIVKGSYQAFKERHSVYIDEETALKYFGDKDPIGKVLTFGFSRGVVKEMVVGGVLAKVPINSSLQMKILLRFEHFEEMRNMDSKPWEDWNVPATFFELNKPENAEQIAIQLEKYISLRNEAFKEQEVIKYTLEPFKSNVDPDVLTWSYLNIPMQKEPLIIFSVLAGMILLIACFNLTNTSIAMASTRLKEIGIRKSVGAHRLQIITQLMIETLMVILISLVVGYLMSIIIVPEFVAMWEMPYGMDDLNGVNLIVTLIIIVFIASILAGLYPSFFSTKFHTATLLKGNMKVNGTNFLTKMLVSTQFAISVIVLTAGVVFMQNAEYQNVIDFGYDKDQLLIINIQDSKDYERMAGQAYAIPVIKEISATEHHVGFSAYPNPITFDNMKYDVQHLEFGENYFETMQFKFIEGGPIDYNNANENKDAAVVSRRFTEKLGIQDDPIGQIIDIRGEKRRIKGVIEDFVDNLYRSKEPEPFIFYATIPQRWRQIVVRADAGDLKKANEELEKVWKQNFPSKPYESRYQEDILGSDVQRLNRNLQKIFLFLTVLGGLLSASGIFSLASLNIAKRTKEIGIRKALGASVGHVVMLLNREFIIILILAGLMGSLAGYFGTRWLLDLIYAIHIPMSVVPVFLSALVIFIIGISTTSLTILKAAGANPVDTLRDE